MTRLTHRKVPVRTNMTAAESPKLKNYRRATAAAQGIPAYTPTDVVADHIRALNAMHISNRAIARDAGVSECVVHQAAHRLRPTMQTRIAAPILAVTHQPTEAKWFVLSVGAVRRINALRAIGWSYTTMAAHTSLSEKDLAVINRAPKVIDWPRWCAVRDLYETLSGTPGPRPHLAPGVRAKGNPTPLDWEDHDIDDPRVEVVAQPWKPKSFQEQIADRRARVAELTQAGLSVAEIADRLGVNQRTVIRDRGTLGVAAA